MAIEIRGQCPLLQVFDMSKSIKFYCDLLGFNIVMTSRPGPQFDWALLRREGAELMLNTAYESDKRPATPDPRWVAAHEDTSIYFGCPNVEGAFQHLIAHGIRVKEPRVAHYGMKQLYLADPDGYILCFQWPAEEHNPSSRGNPEKVAGASTV